MKYIILSIFLVYTSSSMATPSQDAVNTAARALYQYEHWDQDVNRFLSHYEHRFTPEERIIGGYIGGLIRIILQKEVKLTYTF